MAGEGFLKEQGLALGPDNAYSLGRSCMGIFIRFNLYKSLHNKHCLRCWETSKKQSQVPSFHILEFFPVLLVGSNLQSTQLSLGVKYSTVLIRKHL